MIKCDHWDKAGPDEIPSIRISFNALENLIFYPKHID